LSYLGNQLEDWGNPVAFEAYEKASEFDPTKPRRDIHVQCKTTQGDFEIASLHKLAQNGHWQFLQLVWLLFLGWIVFG